MLRTGHVVDLEKWRWERVYITARLISLMTTNSLASGNMHALWPSKCKNGRFVYCIHNKWPRPRCHSQMALPLRGGKEQDEEEQEEEEGRVGNAEPVIRNNALAWRQPFCTTSGGTDRHREALALSWHRPDLGPLSSN